MIFNAHINFKFNNMSTKSITKSVEDRLKQFFSFNEEKEEISRLIGPLVRVNISSFKKNEVPRGFISKDRKFVYLLYFTAIPTPVKHNRFFESFIKEHNIGVYKVTSENSDAINKIIDGRYTEMSAKDKKLIVNYSGLPYNTSLTYQNSNPILLALNRNSVLKSVLAKWFEVPVSDLPTELIAPVEDDSMVWIENYFKSINA